MNSLEARLHLGLGISLALVISASWWLGHAALHRSTEAYVLSRLQHDAEALLGLLLDDSVAVRDRPYLLAGGWIAGLEAGHGPSPG